jgi:hypothetical protein
MLNFPFRPGARALIIGLLVTGLAALLVGAILVVTIQSDAMVIPILIGLTLVGGGFIVMGVATPVPSIEHFERTGLYLIPAKNGPVETASKTGMWMGTLGLLLLGAILAGAALYGLSTIRSMAA